MIKKGDKYYCFKTINEKFYKVGKIYTSGVNGCLNDETGNRHPWDFNVLKERFAKIGNYKDELEGFPEAVVDWMLKEQELQKNSRDISVFEKDKTANEYEGGFHWIHSKYFTDSECSNIIEDCKFNIFFDKYPNGIDNVECGPNKTEEKEVYKIWVSVIGGSKFFYSVESRSEVMKEIEKIRQFGYTLIDDFEIRFYPPHSVLELSATKR